MTIDLFALELAFEETREAGEYCLFPKSGRIRFIEFEDLEPDETCETIHREMDEGEDDERLPLDPIHSSTRFRWMQEFVEIVQSIPARTALRRALDRSKPFRNFKDALTEYPNLRAKWFQFEADRERKEIIEFLESVDFEILEIVDSRPHEDVVQDDDDAACVPTPEEHESILRGAWQVAAMGGRHQLSLVLKGSKERAVLKHGLDRSPVYGSLRDRTLEQIEARIDTLIRQGELRIEYFGKLPLIVLTPETWQRVRPWAHRYECQLAAAAGDARTLTKILEGWKNRRREEQLQLLEALTSTELEGARRVLEAWHAVAGKEMREKIGAKLSTTI